MVEHVIVEYIGIMYRDEIYFGLLDELEICSVIVVDASHKPPSSLLGKLLKNRNKVIVNEYRAGSLNHDATTDSQNSDL